MQVRAALLSVFGAILGGGLVYLDRFPWLYDLPLLTLLLGTTWVGIWEWTQIMARRGWHLPISAMNLSGTVVCLFVYYFREPASTEPFAPPSTGPTPLLRQTELALSLLLALLALVLTTTLITYLTTRRHTALRELLLGAGGTACLAGGLSYALLLEYLPRQTGSLQDGSLILVVLLTALWMGEGTARLIDLFLAPPPPLDQPEAETQRVKVSERHPPSRKNRRSRRRPGQRRAPLPPATKKPSLLERFRRLWRQSPFLPAILVFCLVLFARNLWGLEAREALVDGLILAGLILARPLLRRFFQQSNGSPEGGGGEESGPDTASIPRTLRPPARTLVGAVAGVVCTVLIFDFMGERYLGLNTTQAMWAGLAIGLAARAGGRILYALKRACRVRDSGSLLPGCGGLLDRLGGLFLALPAAYYCLRGLL